jgi:threonine/homoserine/homoserine lactone efflux protein
LENLLGFIVAGIALMGSPGPNTLGLAAAGAAFGARRSLAYMIGLTSGMVAVMTIIASGVAGLLLALPGVAPAVTVLAAIYFIWLAWRIATAPPAGEAASGASASPRFALGFAQSLVNPKAYVAMAAMFSGFTLLPGQIVLDSAAKIAVSTVLLFPINILWLHAGAALTRYIRDPRASRAINVTFAVLLIVSVAVVI